MTTSGNENKTKPAKQPKGAPRKPKPAKQGKSIFRVVFGVPEVSLVIIILIMGFILAKFGGTHTDFQTGRSVSNFLNTGSIFNLLENTSYFAIMAVGSCAVIVTAGIDLSVGSIDCLAGVVTAIVLQKMVGAHMTGSAEMVLVALAVCLGVGLLCGVLNGLATVILDVHPFVITLGTLWILRGLAFIVTRAQSIGMPQQVINFTQSSLGLHGGVQPIPVIVMIVISIFGWIYMAKTPAGRRIYAVGGNLEASRYSGIPVSKVLVGVYVLSGLTAGIAAFLSTSVYGAAASSDATGYELYVIAATVVGGTSLLGGRGSAIGAVLGALVIEMIRESISILHLDSNYQQIIVGLAIIVAVVIDRAGANMRQKQMVMEQAKAREGAATPAS